MSIAPFWWSRRFIYFFFFMLLQLLIMQSQPASTAWTVTSTAAFYHCGNTQNILIYELDVLHIFYVNIVCLYEICKFTWFLIWSTSTILNLYTCLILLIQLWATKIDIGQFHIKSSNFCRTWHRYLSEFLHFCTICRYHWNMRTLKISPPNS